MRHTPSSGKSIGSVIVHTVRNDRYPVALNYSESSVTLAIDLDIPYFIRWPIERAHVRDD